MSKFTIGSRINHKYWGQGTVVGNSLGSPVRVPVLYDDKGHGFCDENYEENMEQIPGPAIYPAGTRVYHQITKQYGTVIGTPYFQEPNLKDLSVDVAWEDLHGNRVVNAYVSNLAAAPPTLVHTEADVLEAFERGKLLSAASLRDEHEAGYKEGHDAAYASLMAAEFKRAADAAVENAAYHGDAKTGKQLLNELYHDRARLETALQDATKVIDSFMYILECQRVGDDMDTDTDEDRVTLTDEEHISWVYGIGQQFVDTYGDKE